MLYLMIVGSLILTVIVNITTSVYACYNVATDADEPASTLMTVGGLLFINALFPFVLGCMVGLWYIP